MPWLQQNTSYTVQSVYRGLTPTYDVEYILLRDVSHILDSTSNFTLDCKFYTINWQSYYKIFHSITLKYFRCTLNFRDLLNLLEFREDSLIL
jgi:hypothetical protein